MTRKLKPAEAARLPDLPEKRGPFARHEFTWMLLLALLALAIRKPDSLSAPQFWAEDGTVYFLGDYTHGLAAIFHPYAGYLSIVPRLVAFLAGALLPYAAIPWAYNYASLGLNLLPVAAIYSPRFQAKRKALLALSLALVPSVVNEVFLNITNAQWLLAILLLIVLLKTPPDKSKRGAWVHAAGDAAAIVLCGLTGPFLILMLPVAIWMWARRRTRYAAGILALCIAVSAVQAWVLFMNPEPVTGTDSLTLPYVAVTTGTKLVGLLFLTAPVTDAVNPYVLFALFLLLIAFLLVCSRSSSAPNYPFARVCIFVLIAVMGASLYKHRRTWSNIMPLLNGTRYAFVPHVMTLWALIACMGEKRRARNAVIYVLLCMAFATFLVTSINISSFNEDLEWSTYSKAIGKGQTIRVPLNPGPWTMDVPPYPHGKGSTEKGLP